MKHPIMAHFQEPRGPFFAVAPPFFAAIGAGAGADLPSPPCPPDDFGGAAFLAPDLAGVGVVAGALVAVAVAVAVTPVFAFLFDRAIASPSP